MLDILKTFSLAIIIGIIGNYIFFDSINDFIMSSDKYIVGVIVIAYDLGVLALMIEAYINGKK